MQFLSVLLVRTLSNFRWHCVHLQQLSTSLILANWLFVRSLSCVFILIFTLDWWNRADPGDLIIIFCANTSQIKKNLVTFLTPVGPLSWFVCQWAGYELLFALPPSPWYLGLLFHARCRVFVYICACNYLLSESIASFDRSQPFLSLI